MGSTAQARRPVVLLVEPGAEERARLARELSCGGLTVWLAGSGREALITCRRHRGAIDLVLLPVSMPGLDGPQTLASLREVAPQLRAVFVGDRGEHTREELLGMGAASVLERSTDMAGAGEIARAVWRVLPARR